MCSGNTLEKHIHTYKCASLHTTRNLHTTIWNCFTSLIILNCICSIKCHDVYYLSVKINAAYATIQMSLLRDTWKFIPITLKSIVTLIKHRDYSWYSVYPHKYGSYIEVVGCNYYIHKLGHQSSFISKLTFKFITFLYVLFQWIVSIFLGSIRQCLPSTLCSYSTLKPFTEYIIKCFLTSFIMKATSFNDINSVL